MILQKKIECRNREEVQKLISYFKDLKFFENLKKDNDVEEDIIYYCCKELKYRKYEDNTSIINYGEEGNEFFIIIEGEVEILTPKQIEMRVN